MVVVVLLFFIDNLIRWITLSILTFGVHIKKNAQPECFAAFHITWNFMSEKLYPQKQPSTFRLFYVIAECKETRSKNDRTLFGEGGAKHSRRKSRRKVKENPLCSVCNSVVCTTISNFVTNTEKWQSIDFAVCKQFDCDSFVDNVFINISALVHTDMIIDAVNFVIEIRASGGRTEFRSTVVFLTLSQR